jgi:hypothetical protein
MKLSEIITEAPSRSNPAGPKVAKMPSELMHLIQMARWNAFETVPEGGMPKSDLIKLLGGDKSLNEIARAAEEQLAKNEGAEFAQKEVEEIVSGIQTQVKRRLE